MGWAFALSNHAVSRNDYGSGRESILRNVAGGPAVEDEGGVSESLFDDVTPLGEQHSRHHYQLPRLWMKEHQSQCDHCFAESHFVREHSATRCQLGRVAYSCFNRRRPLQRPQLVRELVEPRLSTPLTVPSLNPLA